MAKVAIFYHVGQMGNWHEIYNEQLSRLKAAGLLDQCSHLHIGINGDNPLPFIPEGANVVYNTNQVLEADTLTSLWHFASNNPDYKILYLHTKGTTRFGTPLERVAKDWRYYLEYFCVDGWRRCVEELNTYDICGAQLRDKAYYNENEDVITLDALYYDGNFWWANASYITRLDTKYLYTDDTPWLRGKSELWIGTGKPNAKNLFALDGDSYERNYSPEVYEKKYMMNKKTKFVAICMFKNEAGVIERMLNSCLPYIDYYVFQDNGSTDGTNEIVKKFLLDNKLSGTLYECEEGWKGFGWNRDHLIKYCQEEVDHGCDWIIKMDCDETLQIDDSFDWSIFDDKSMHSFHVPAKAVNTTCMYYRAWIWNASMKWRFQHDPCHEVVYCEDESIGFNFVIGDLPRTFAQVGYDEGQSWGNPTKFVTDSLVLENKLISEKEMLSNMYHFWYLAKSYFDAHECNDLPFEMTHRKEMARRSIFYYDRYLNAAHKGDIATDSEMCYVACILIAYLYIFLDCKDAAILYYDQASAYVSYRNDHLIGKAILYKQRQQYDKYLEMTSQMLEPDRTNPFPTKCCVFIDDEDYYDTGTKIRNMYEDACNLVSQEVESRKQNIFEIQKPTKKLFVVDNVYSDPDAVRSFALSCEFKEDLRFYKGIRTTEAYRPHELKALFESIIGENIYNWDEYGFNGCFQITRAHDPQVYHYDEQKWAAMIYLTPNAPLQSGTRLHRSIINNTTSRRDIGADDAFQGNFYDSTKFDILDAAGNVYNRLVIMDAGSFHSAGPYFGDSNDTGRLVHLFFFD